MIIRPLETDEIPLVLELDRACFADLFARLTGRSSEFAMREAEYFEFWSGTDPEGAMVAELDGEIVALSMCHARGAAGWIGPLAVRPDLQSQGLGKQLMEAAFDYFARRECQWVGLDTYPQNPVSVSLYLKHGMRVLQTMLQLQLLASEWRGRIDAAAPRQVVPASMADLDALVDVEERVSGFHRGPDFRFLLQWDKARVFRLMDGRICVGQVCAYQKRQKGVVAGLYLSRLDTYLADLEALLSACMAFFAEIGMERVVVFSFGDDRRLFEPLLKWGARTIQTTIRLFRGDDRSVPMHPDRAFVHTPFASEKG